MPVLRRIAVYPVKSLDPLDRARVRVVDNGGLAGDREFAIVDADGEYVNGKRTPAVHPVRTAFDPESRVLRVALPAKDEDVPAVNAVRPADVAPRKAVDRDAPADDVDRAFAVDTERDALAEWLSAYFGRPVSVVRKPDGGFPDDTAASGPTIISTASLREMASWYDDIDADEMRRRLRPNLEVGAAPGEPPLDPFWEDRLFSDRESTVPFVIGDARFDGVNPCQRCVVPTRDPDTGAETPGFRERFVEMRRRTLPAWSGGDRFDHHYRVMVNTRVDPSSWGAELRVGDEVRLRG